MLTRAHRFHGHASLNYVYRHGSTVRGPQIALRYVRNNRRSDYRVAVIVSRKVHKSAVQRNRIRRRIYEIVRTGKSISQSFDIVITIFSEQMVEMPPAELQHLIYGLLGKAGVYISGSARSSGQVHDIVESREDNR